MRIIMLTGCLFILMLSVANATIINVPGDQPTIQAGINIAMDGDTVLVADGTYTGADNKNLDFVEKSITVTSVNGAENTIIDCEGDGRGFYFHSGEDSTSVVDGFTITNGFGDYGTGVYCFNSSPKLINLTLTNGSADGGGGIMCHNYANPILSNLIITDNGADLGGGIMCWQYSSPHIENVIIFNNQSNLGAGANFLANSCPTLENVSIRENFSYLIGGGISCSDNSNITLKNVTISGNTSNGSGGGMHCASSSPVLDSVTVSDNTTAMQGAGIIFIQNSNPSLTNVTISGNSINGTFIAQGGGIACVDNSNPSMMNVTIINNSVIGDNALYVYGAGLMCYNNSNPNLINVTISENTAAGTAAFIDGGGIYVSSGNLILLNSIIWNNSPNEIYLESGSVTATYSDIQDGWTGIGNIDADPLFADPQNGDFHLTWANFPIPDSTKSPCIDAGDPSSPLDPDDTIADMGAFYFDQTQTGVGNISIIPKTVLLYQNYPNPFNPETTIKFTTENTEDTKIEIYNIKGQKIKTFVIGQSEMVNGKGTIVWNGKNNNGKPVSSGVYLYQLNIDGKPISTKKMLLMK